MPSRLSAWLAQSGLLMMTLFGLRMTRLLPIAAAISRRKGWSAMKARLARSSPAVRETRLVYPPGAGGAAGGSSAASARAGGSRQVASAAALPNSEALRNSRREVKRFDFIVPPFCSCDLC